MDAQGRPDAGPGGLVSTDNPAIVYTADPSGSRGGGTAADLIQRAQQKGQIRVILGLRIVMQPEHTLNAAAAARQRQRLRQVQNGVAQRVLTRTNGDDILKYDSLPYLSLFVNGAQVQALLQDPDVVSVQEDVPVPPHDVNSIPLIHVDTVWGKGFDGTGFTVAVLDTGVSKSHPVLSGRVISEACYSTNSGANIRSTCPGGVTSSTAPGSGVNCTTAIDGCKHGTHVASIAAAKQSALNLGVARDARIIAVQVFTRFNLDADCGGAGKAPCVLSYSSDQIKALERIYALRGTYAISSVNMSLGGGKYAAACDAANPALTTAITNLRNVKIATLIASGNNGYTGFISSPACISKAIAIGNSTKQDLLARSSNHSALVKLLAPGTSINGAVPGSAYEVLSGTSMATPHVAGAFAVMRDLKADATVDQILNSLTCSGKIIDRGVLGAGSEAISPAKPRIDLIGAYNRLLATPNSARSWIFTNPKEALDWTVFTGTWAVGAGRYQQTPIQTGWIGTSTANCNNHFSITTKMTRVDPGTTFYSNSGLIVRTSLDYKNHTVSGYWLAYNKCRTDSSGYCTGDLTDPVGQAVLWRMDDYNFPSASGGGTLLCQKQSAVSVNGLNTLRVVSNGSSLSYYLNGNLVCTVDDSTYVSGPTMAAAYIAASGGHAYQLDQLSYVETAASSPLSEAVIDAAAMMPKAVPAGISPAGSRPVK